MSWQGRCGPARYHWLNCHLALEYMGKDCDLARKNFVGLCHCSGDPASRGCSGLASETIAKLSSATTTATRAVFLSSWAVALCRFSADVPSLSAALTLVLSAAPCERSWLVRRSSLEMPYRLWGRSALPCLSQGCVQ